VTARRKPGAGRRPVPSSVRRSARHPDTERVVVRLTDAAFEDLHVLLRLDPQIVRWALKKMLSLERDPEAGEVLHGELIGFRKLVVGDRGWRVVWRVTHDDTGAVVVDVAEVWAVGARSDAAVYAEMQQRVARLPTDQPATLALAEVIDRLGRVAAGVRSAPEPDQRAELPDWLVQRLQQQVGMDPNQIATLTLEKAVDAWTDWSARSR
jgi:mRNA interferase RelE/StbE